MQALTYVELDAPLFDDERQAGFGGAVHLSRGGGLTGAADSKQLTFAAWVYIDSGTDGQLITSVSTVGGGTFRTRVFLASGTNKFSIQALNAAATTICYIESSVIPFGVWTHVMASFDLTDPTKRHIYVNGIEDLAAVTTYTNDTIDFTHADWGVGGYPNGVSRLDGAIADLWFQPGLYVDLSLARNRRKFLGIENRPAFLKADGSGPTGSAPLVYLSGALASWHTNKGTGGGFTLTGTLAEFKALPTTYRFAMSTSYLPADIDAIPSIAQVNFTPSRLALGESLGQRASIRVSFKDHLHIHNGEPYDQGSFWGKWRGRYGTTLRGCKLRIIRGQVGQALADMDIRHYLVDTSDGPTAQDAIYVIEAKDVLKFADEDRAQAPLVSNGRLGGSLTSSATSATLVPSGIGNAEYPASGWVCLGGKEVVSFTRSGDSLTITRGQFGSIAQTHDAADRVQLVKRYTGDTPATILSDLLVTYAGVPAEYIEQAEWDAEVNDNLGVLYARTITEPTSVRKLVNELIEQAALAVWWDDRAQRIRLQVLREIATDTDTFDEERIIDGTLKVKEQPDKRISQIWTFYNQRDPTNRGAEQDNFRSALADVDLEKETEYGSAEIEQIQAPWIATENAATRLNAIKLSRFRDPPRVFQFDLGVGELVSVAGGYQLAWTMNQDRLGLAIPAKIQVTQVEIRADRIYVEAEEMLASGDLPPLLNIVLLTGTGSGSFEVPATWNDADNAIHCIGAGGAGGADDADGGGGGGGGAYSRRNNLNRTPGEFLPYTIGSGGIGVVKGNGNAGGDTWFGHASFGSSLCGAKGGAGGGTKTPGAGGQASAGIGDVKRNGGTGGFGAEEGSVASGGGGGGGAGGPNGNGGTGGSNDTQNVGAGGGGADGGFTGAPGQHGDSKTEQGGNGGNNRFNFGGGNASQPTGAEGGGGKGGNYYATGAAGGAGELAWTQTINPIISAGPGGGGGGGGTRAWGGNGGLYGGGGGGAGEDGAGGNGRQGLIVVQWRT